jgi:ankyrin repeat protein
MAPYLVPELSSTNDVSTITKRVVEYLDVVLPLDHDYEILDHLKLAFADSSQRSTWEFLKLAVYLLSNKLLLKGSQRSRAGVKVIGDEFLKWFQIGNNRMFCRTILAIKTPSIDAFAEIIFCSAVENGVTSMIRMFLESGIDPNTFVEHGHNSLTPLQFAAVTGNIQMAKVLLEYGANMKARDTRTTLESAGSYVAFPQTPLQIAARKGNLELVKLLISAGAAINTDETFWSSALQNAAKARHYEIAQLLLDAKADIDTCFGRYGCALACAIEEKCKPLIKLLLDNNADVNSSGASGITPLQSAAMVNDEAIVSYLLLLGAKVNTQAPTNPTRTDRTKTALQWAVYNGNMNIVSLLLDAGANINYSQGRTALEVAVETKDHKMIFILLDAGADPSKDGSVSLAVKASDVGLILALLQRGAGINNISHDIPTALYQAAVSEDLEMVQFLLDRGADPNIQLQNNYMGSVLQVLTRSRSMKIIEAIIQAGADINGAWSSKSFRNPSLNPLQIAASNGDLELVEYFVAANADVNWPASEYNGRTALQKAVENRHMHIVEFLLKNGANINAPARSKNGVTALQAAVSQNHLDLVEFLLENGANPDDQPSRVGGFSALQLAAKSGNNDLILKLVLAGAKVNGPPADEYGLYAIQAAALYGHITTVKLLIQLHADVNAPACFKGGYTALQAAVSKGHLKIIELLLERGADVNAPGCLGSSSYQFKYGTALVIAAHGGHIRMAKLLLAKGANLIVQGAMPALYEAARNGRLDMMKLLITRARESPEFNRNHLKTALDAAKKAGHTAAAKFLECHKVIVGNSCGLRIRE